MGWGVLMLCVDVILRYVFVVCGLTNSYAACFNGAMWVFLELCSMSYEVGQLGGL